MRRITVLFAVLSLFIAVGAARASITVDFSVLGANTVDITVQNNPAGLTLNGVNFGYDNFGSPADVANANSAGILGTTLGVLLLSFSDLVTGLNLDFSVLDVTGPEPETLLAIFDNGDFVVVPGTFVPNDPNNPTLGDIVGSLAYQNLALPFTQATLFFSPVAEDLAPPVNFTVSNVSYDVKSQGAIPEPSTIIIWSVLGGFGLIVGKWRRRRT
jgi:hypothetical protein